MDSAKCARCGNEFPASGMMRLDGQRYCAVCGEQVMAELNSPAQAQVDAPGVSGCAVCGAGGGLQQVGGAALCANCAHTVYNRDFPKWLKLGLLAALALLAVALVSGLKYFKIGRTLYHGEKIMARGEYSEAEKQLKDVVVFAPDCKKCVLLYAKAALLAGDPGPAYTVVQGKTFEEDALYREVDAIFERTTRALDLLKKSGEQANADQTDDALKSLNGARAVYPEFKGYDVFETQIQVADAFIKKDYDRFLKLEQAQLVEYPDNPMVHAGIASALACKYAVTGDPAFSRDAEAALDKAKQLSGNDPQQQAAFREYSERIEYRLKTREIIDKKEYDKRFRPEAAKKGAN